MMLLYKRETAEPALFPTIARGLARENSCYIFTMKGNFTMDIKQAFSEEIRRLARKEIKAALLPVQNTVASLKKLVAEQKRQIAMLEKRCGAPAEETAFPAVENAESDKSVRINASGILRLRTKMGLTQSEFAKLLGVAMHTVSVWEQGRRVPRYSHKVRICALRGLGKRELKKMLESSDAKKPAPAGK